jgi:hypothetical protein
MLRQARHRHPDKNLSTLTLVAVFGTDDPLYINNLPRETFDAQVDAMKRELGLPVAPSEAEVAERRAKQDAARAEARAKQDAARAEARAKQDAARAEARAKRESELAERRAEWEAGTPMFKHDGCSIALPENNFERNFSVHLTAHELSKAGQPPTPVTLLSHYCRSMTACTDCQTWVQKVAEGSVSLETLGAGWVPSRDQVLRCAARVRAALPEITFGGVELPEVRYRSGMMKSEDKLMGLTMGQAVGAIKHALAKCNARGVMGDHMHAATYHSSFVPHFMAHLDLTDVKKVPARTTLHAVYMAHKRGDADVAEGAGPSKRGLTAPPARKRGPTAPPARSSTRARKATKVTDV